MGGAPEEQPASKASVQVIKAVPSAYFIFDLLFKDADFRSRCSPHAKPRGRVAPTRGG
jgi:hypothetical protein